MSRGDCPPAEILPRRRIAPWLTKKWVGSSKAAKAAKAANRGVNRAASRVVSRNQVSKIRHLDAKAVSKAVVANKVDNKAVSRAQKIVRLSFCAFAKRNPPVPRRGIFRLVARVLNNTETDSP